MSEIRRPKRQKAKGLAFSSVQKPTYEKPAQAGPIQTQTDGHVSSAPGTVKTRLLLLSDTHGKSKIPQGFSFQENTHGPRNHLPEESSLNHPKIDVLIHTGDLSDSGSLADYQATLGLLSSIPARLKLVIPGNHDLTLDNEFWERHSTVDGKGLSKEAKKLFKTKVASDEKYGPAAGKKKGDEIILLENGTHEFNLENGGVLRIYAGARTPYPDSDGAGIAWAFGYPSNTDIYNPPGKGISYATTAISQSQSLISDNADLDIMMTHGPPKYRLDQRRLGTGDTQAVALGCPHLFRAVRRARPKLHVFGHVHEGYGAELIEWATRPKNDALPDDDDVDDGIMERIILFGDETGDSVRRLDTRTLKAMRKERLRIEGLREVEREGGDTTLFINAALMGSEGELENLPWVIELELQTSDSTTNQ